MADPNLLEGIDAPNLMEGVGEPHPIDPMQRLIIQNVFDSQPKRRKGYLEKLGWEMGPDENKIRPIGDKTPWKDVTSKIDPEFSDVYKKGKFFENFGENLKKVATEAGQDVGDVIGDFAEGAGSSALAANMGMVGSLGSPGIGIMAAIAGGGIGTRASEAVKGQIGDLLLDKEIPVDQGLAATQALMSGVLGGLGDAPAVRKALRSGGEGVSSFIADRFKTAREGLKEAIAKAGGVNPAILEKYASNPTMFSKEASAGGRSRLRETFRKYFGLDPEDFAPTRNPERILPESEFGKALAPLRASEGVELQNLVSDPKAKITYGDYIGQFLPKMEEYMGMGRLKPKEQQALNVFKQEIEELAKDAGINPKIFAGTKEIGDKEMKDVIAELSAKEMPFDKFTRNLDILQDKAFQADPITGFASKNADVAQAAGTLRRLRDTVADESFARRKQLGLPTGESLSQIKAKQSRILDAFEKTGNVATPDKIERAFLGKDSNAQREVIGSLAGLDDVLGTDFKTQLETGAFQAGVDSLFQPGAYTPKGSSRVNAAAIEGAYEGAKEGLVGGLAAGGTAALTGGGTPVAAALTLGGMGLGAVRGARNAAKLANPESALAALAKNSEREQALRAFAQRIGAGGEAAFGPQATSALETGTESMLLREKLKDIGGGIEQWATEEPKKPEPPNLLEGI